MDSGPHQELANHLQPMDEDINSLLLHFMTIEKQLYGKKALTPETQGTDHIDQLGNLIIDAECVQNLEDDYDTWQYFMNKMIILSLNNEGIKDFYIDQLN